MVKIGSWVDHPVIAAMAEVLQRPIHIYTASQQSLEPGYISVDPSERNKDADPIILGHVPEWHYYSLTEESHQPGIHICI